MRILIVHHDLSFARTVEAMLVGHDVEIESDSVSALARVFSVDRTRARFDVVLSASKMPGMTGADLRSGLLTHPDAAIFVSMSDDDSELEGTADGCLRCPFSRARLLELIEALLEERRSLRTRRLQTMRVAG